MSDSRGDDYAKAKREAIERPHLFTLIDYPDGTWRLVTEDGYVAAWGEVHSRPSSGGGDGGSGVAL